MPDYGLELGDDGCPTDATLETIAAWPIEDGYHELLGAVEALWSYPDCWERDGDCYRVSTGGWSGNESLIGALEQNTLFWMLCWVSSRRGGHYEFEVPRLEREGD